MASGQRAIRPAIQPAAPRRPADGPISRGRCRGSRTVAQSPHSFTKIATSPSRVGPIGIITPSLRAVPISNRLNYLPAIALS